jgi:hypothetical protein
MGTIDRKPEAEGLEFVALGSFNPAIFHPEWFLRQKLIQEDDAKAAMVVTVASEVADVQMRGLRLLCVPNRFSLGTSNLSQATPMQDLLIQIFTLLSHIPITSCGINPFAHYSVKSVEYYHKIGHTLAPKQHIWDELLDKPGMLSLTINAPRKGDFPGAINVTVEPSMTYSPGIFVRTNYHYNLPTEAAHAGASDRLLNFIKTEWHPACEMVHRVADKIFEKIRPDNDN